MHLNKIMLTDIACNNFLFDMYLNNCKHVHKDYLFKAYINNNPGYLNFK